MTDHTITTPAGKRHRHSKLRRVLPEGATFTPQPEPTSDYTHAGRVFAEFSATFLWLLFWLFNGGCTAVSVAALAQWLANKITHGHPPFWVSYWLMVPVGIIVHLIFSSIEQHVWKSGTEPEGTLSERLAAMASVRTAEAVIVGSLDGVTTSRVIRVIALFFGAPATFATTAVCSLVGVMMALIPEPMLRYHGVSLKALTGWKGQRR